MKKLHKEIILAIFIVLFGAISWFLLHQFLYSGNSITFLILTIFGFLFLGISISLGSLLIDKKIILFSGFALYLLSFFVFFGNANEALYYFVVLVLIFVSLSFYQKRVKREEKTRIKLNFWRIFKRGLPLVFTLICVLVSLAYYFSPTLGGASKLIIKIPEGLFNTGIKPIEGLIQEKLPQGINLDSELDKVLSSDQIKDIEKQLGIVIKKGDTGRDILYKFVDSRINNFGGAYKTYIPIALAVGLFLALRIFSIFLIALIALFSYFAVKILISTGFARIVIKTVGMEDIEI